MTNYKKSSGTGYSYEPPPVSENVPEKTEQPQSDTKPQSTTPKPAQPATSSPSKLKPTTSTQSVPVAQKSTVTSTSATPATRPRAEVISNAPRGQRGL